jgi:hypothetical protein
VSGTNFGVLEGLKDASLLLFLSLGLLYLGILIPALGFLISLVGLFLLIGNGAPRIRSVLRDLQLIGLLKEDRSNWVSILNLSAVGIVIGEIFLAASRLLLLSLAHPIGFGLSAVGDAILALSLVGAFVASVFLGTSLGGINEVFRNAL